MLNLLAHAASELLAGFIEPLHQPTIDRIQNRIGAAFTDLEMIGAEARRERAHHFVLGPDQGPLLRTLMRLRHDLIMIGRAATKPLPEAFQQRLGPELNAIAAATSVYLNACAACLRTHGSAPPFDAIAQTIAAFTAGLNNLREDGLMRNLPAEDVERIFALAFALDQFSLNLKDLQRCIAEFAHSPMKAATTPSVRTA
jgi:hypothetical protein